MKLLLFVLFLGLVESKSPRQHRHVNRASTSLKRTIDYDALKQQQLLYFCMQKDGVDVLQEYLTFRNNPKKRKSEIAANHEKIVRKLSSSNNSKVSKCMKDYVSKEAERQAQIDQRRAEDRKKMTPAARRAFDQVNKILDDGSLTIKEEVKRVRKIGLALKGKDRFDLITCNTLYKLDRLAALEDPYDYLIPDMSRDYPLLTTTVKELNLELLYYCLRLGGRLNEYWSIERKAGLKMIDVWNKEQAFFKKLISNDENAYCYNNYLKREKERRSLQNKERKSLAAKMSSGTKRTYKKINGIRDELELTIDEHIQKIKKIERSMDSTARTELFNIVPELKRYYNAGKYSTL
ncbi:hypothetical protein M3Y95_01204900 [Aphelenchoides besseyi]|nr:hypothetical protein M3Y95_01204900 [Aphelenchoides besseyi]